MGEMRLRMMISPPSTAALITPPPIRQMNKLLLAFSSPSTTTSKRMIPLLKFSSTLSCFPRRRRVNPIPTTTTSSLENYGIIMMSLRRVVPIPARDRVIDFGKYKGKTLGSLPSSYLKWVTKNLRAGDSVEWASLADEVLSDPIYRDRIEWELAEKVLNGDSSSAGHNNSSKGGAVSELLEISERFGWDNEDKSGWSKIDFGLLGTSKGGRIPRRQQQQLRGGDDDDVGGGAMKKTKKGEEEISEEDKRGRGGRNERRERMRMRRQRRGEEEGGSGSSTSSSGGTTRSMRIRMQEEMGVVVVGGYGNRKEVEISNNSNKGGQTQSESESVKKKKVNNDEDGGGDEGNGDGAAAAVVGSGTGTGTGTGTGRSPFPGREALFNKLLLLNRQR